MNSLRRIILTALVGAIIVISLAVANAAPGPVLRRFVPEIEGRPDTTGSNYTQAQFEKLAAWEKRYGTPCVLVIFGLVDRPVYSFDGQGSAYAIFVLPMTSLARYRAQIEKGDAAWAPLSEVVTALSAAPPTAVPDTATAEALQRARDAAAKAVAILTQP